jgi:hypothetical protein
MLTLQQQKRTAIIIKSEAVFLKSSTIMKNKIDSHAAMHGCVVKINYYQNFLG